MRATFLHNGMTVDMEITITYKTRHSTRPVGSDQLIGSLVVDYFESDKFKEVFLTNGKNHVPYPFLKGAVAIDLTKYLKPFNLYALKKISVTRLAHPGNIEIDITYHSSS